MGVVWRATTSSRQEELLAQVGARNHAICYSCGHESRGGARLGLHCRRGAWPSATCLPVSFLPFIRCIPSAGLGSPFSLPFPTPIAQGQSCVDERALAAPGLAGREAQLVFKPHFTAMHAARTVQDKLELRQCARRFQRVSHSRVRTRTEELSPGCRVV